MKVALLAGGRGTRLVEETATRSKAMVEVGGRPILWHIMRYYESFGLTEFVIALGYKGDTIRDFFATHGFRSVAAHGCQNAAPSNPFQRWQDDRWTVDLVETGLDTENGGRLKRLAPLLGDATFMLTWCDGLADVDLHRLRDFHQGHGRLATLTAVHPPPRFGRLDLNGDQVSAFREKTVDENEWINGAFFVLEPGVFDCIEGDHSSFERHTLPGLADARELMARRHEGFWQCMDTLKEAEDLNKLWMQGDAPWKVW